MSLLPDEIRSEIENALGILSEQRGVEWAGKIRPILYANLERGRVEAFVEDDPTRVVEYMWRVFENYQHFSGLLHQLQFDKTSVAWSPLLEQMAVWAYRFLLKRGSHEGSTTWENAQECASESARRLLGAYFPFDTEFEAWARVIVQNVCMKFMEKVAKEVPVLEESLESFQDSLLLSTQDPDDLLVEIKEGIEQLTPLRRDVIVMKYFMGLSPAEIASKLGKSVRAVHSLQFHAIQDMRKILTKNRDKLND